MIERKRALGDVEGYFDYLDHLVTNLTVAASGTAQQLIDETLEYDRVSRHRLDAFAPALPARGSG